MDFDNIPIEVWKSLGDQGIVLLTSLFNKITRFRKISSMDEKFISANL